MDERKVDPAFTPDRVERDAVIHRFALILGIILTILTSVTYFIGVNVAGKTNLYLGEPFNTDDHMVYGAWIRQSANGAFFMDNRFAVEDQPGLTVHLYFWMVGKLAAITSVPFASVIAKAIFTFLFVMLLARFLKRTDWSAYVCKAALMFACLGGGLGFMFWQNFGRAVETAQGRVLGALTGYRLPIDVWQPEAFVFPSMLTNGLFMVSLCLMIVTLTAIVDAKKSWIAVIPGAISYGILMNIHSYDVLLLGMVMVVFAVCMTVRREMTWVWFMRSVLIGCGAIPGGLWFMRVLKEDSIFAARAATPTYAPSFPVVVCGVLCALALAIYGLHAYADQEKRAKFAAPAWLGMILMLWLAWGTHADVYRADATTFGIVFLLMGGIAVLASKKDVVWTLVVSWAMVALVAPYFPALFQRKLAAGMIIPLGILAAFGMVGAMKKLDRDPRNLATAFFGVLICGISPLWFQREIGLIRANVSTTTVHPAMVSKEVADIGWKLMEVAKEKKTVILAMPGIPAPTPNRDAFDTPYVPDLNTIMPALSGVYAYAGHWSETPDYNIKRNRASMVFMRDWQERMIDPAGTEGLIPRSQTEAMRQAMLDDMKIDYLIMPNPEAYPDLKLADLTQIGSVQYTGDQFILIRLR